MTSPKRKVVVSGISCRLPFADNMDELKKNLLNGIDMVNSGKQRMNSEIFGLPRFGQINDLSKFDAGFFGVSAVQANKMDPSLRILMEVTYEAIVDAGIDPITLRKSDTGVYVGSGPSEFHFAMSDDIDKISGYEMTGSEQCMLANRLSNWFDFQGPSLVVNTACSSSLVALDQAVKDLRQGVCTSAIVAGVNVICHPGMSKELHKLGIISPTGRCASFDKEADGYCRSEGVIAIIIQSKEMARRVYCEIVHSKVNNNGRSSNGIIFPSKDAQCKLFREFYKEANVNPSDIDYIEAHATGTQAGDKIEVESLAEVFCSQRKNPLKIGSVKSNLGHTENASGLVSLAKVIIAMETRIIPKNLHFTTPDNNLTEICNGKLEVVHENMCFTGDFIALNNFGFGGTNAHVLLKPNNTDIPFNLERHIPPLITYCSREQSSIKECMDKITKYDQYFHALLTKTNLMRGMTKIRAYSTANETLSKTVDKCNSEQQVWYIFSGMGVQWHGMGKSLMEVRAFRESIQKSNISLQKLGIDLEEIIEQDKSLDDKVNTPIMITAIQMALYDLLCEVGIKPDGIIGHSVGELACAYADGCLSREETLFIAYKRAFCIHNADLPHGAMAAIGLSLEKAKCVLPREVVVACHNAQDSVTVSGRSSAIERVINDLKEKGVFAKYVETSGIAFHSSDLYLVEESFKESVKSVLEFPRMISKQWISTITPECIFDTDSPTLLTVDYLTKSLTSPVMFYEATRHIPDGAFVIEIAPHCLLQPLLRRSLPGNCYITGLMKRGMENPSHFMSSLGKLFERGLHFDSSLLDNQMTFPVPTDTPMVSPLVKWDHAQTWDIPFSYTCTGFLSKRHFIYSIDLSNGGEFSHIRDHKINGRLIFPAAGYIHLTWKSFAKMLGKKQESQSVKFIEVEFHRAVILQEGDNDMREASLEIDISESTGRFEVTECGSLVASGYVCQSEISDSNLLALVKDLPSEKICSSFELDKMDVYKELSIRGYTYGKRFQCIESSSDLNALNGTLRCSGHWDVFLDALLQYSILSKLKRGLYIPKRLGELLIHPDMAYMVNNFVDIPVQFVPFTDICKCPCALIRGLDFVPIAYADEINSLLLESYKFILYSFNNNSPDEMNIQSAIFEYTMNTEAEKEGMENDNQDIKDLNETELTTCLDIVIENSPMTLNILDIDCNDKITIANTCLSRHPGYQARYYNLNGKMLEKCKIVYENDRYNLTDENSGLEDLSKSTTDFHLVLCRDEGYSEKTRSLIRNIIGEGTFVLVDSLETEVTKALWKFESLLDVHNSFVVIYDYNTPELKRNILCRKKRVNDGSDNIFIYTSLDNFDWISRVKKSINSRGKKTSDYKLWLVSDEKNSGLLGFVKCLGREKDGNNIRCIVNQSNIPIENQGSKMNDIIAADLVYNVIDRKGKIGSYRHMPLTIKTQVQTRCAHLQIKQTGNLSSLQWIQSADAVEGDEKNQTYTVCYSALNFRDVMLATGKLSPAANPGKHTSAEQMLGMEFSGFDEFGNRVMGLSSDLQGISSSVSTRSNYVWSVPDEWTLEQAASVPMAYLSAYFALVVRGNIAKGESILIHSGSGGLGQAAISIALSYECEIFTTVSSVEKTDFLLTKYPKLDKHNIFSSRNTDFEQQIRLKTKGAGVDIVLNSLAGDLLYASVRVLNNCGRFLDMGKYDLFQNSSLGMQMFLKNASFHGVHLDFLLFDETNSHLIKRVSDCFIKGISDGVVKPLHTTVFDTSNVEDAFRLMTKGKHIGKVLIKMMDENNHLKPPPLISAQQRVFFSSSKWYIITGGLGGIGLELAEWLSNKGAKLLVLTSRTGVRTGYQKRKLAFLHEKGITVRVSTQNVSQLTEAESLLREFRPLGGIFHLAMVLKDGLIENQNETTFERVFDPKAQAAINLDKLTRLNEYICDWFVCFSSIASGRGNAGQTSYGYANSVTETLCENRKRDSFHGLAIQFGPISQVGVFHETIESKTSTLAGAVPQGISSCLSTLEILLTQSEPVVSCFQPEDETKENGKKEKESTLVSSIFRIIGIDEQKIIDEDMKLNELGLDSLTSIEVRQILERQTSKAMSLEQVKNITVKELKQL